MADRRTLELFAAHARVRASYAERKREFGLS